MKTKNITEITLLNASSWKEVMAYLACLNKDEAAIDEIRYLHLALRYEKAIISKYRFALNSINQRIGYSNVLFLNEKSDSAHDDGGYSSNNDVNVVQDFSCTYGKRLMYKWKKRGWLVPLICKLKKKNYILSPIHSKLDGTSNYKCQLWLPNMNSYVFDSRPVKVLYKSPITDYEVEKIMRFTEFINLELYSSSKRIKYNVRQILRLLTDHISYFKLFNDYSHYFFLFTLTNPGQFALKKLKQIILHVLPYLKYDYDPGLSFSWAVIIDESLSTGMKLEIFAGKSND